MAKSDKTGQFPALNIEQLNAIDLLVVGKTDQEVAEQIGKTRQTVCNWRLYHPLFQAELNRRRATIWGTAADRLRGLLPKALDVISQELDGEQRLKVALALVKLASVTVNKIGAQEAEEIVEGIARQRNWAVMALMGNGVDLARLRRELLEKAEIID